MSTDNTTTQLLGIAKATNFTGNRELAKTVTLLAFKSNDIVDALDRLLPKVQDPMSKDEFEEVVELSEQQVGKILTLAKELRKREKQHLAAKILAKVEALEELKKRKRRSKSD